jgi:NodT family efflux transporter outer membrane factor (OMF) lipoprotein
VEAATADLEATREAMRDVMVSLLSEVALNYLDVRTFQAAIKVAKENLKSQEDSHRVAVSRYEAGLTNELSVQQAAYNMENTRSRIPVLRTSLKAAMNRLCVLLGLQPGALNEELAGDAPIPVPPLRVAVGVPADALRRRPDIRRAERLLAARTAEVGVATADLYPKFDLVGSIGLESLSLGNVFSASGLAYLIGPKARWPVFDAGAIRSNIQVQTERQQQALIQYESAVLTALEEVENAMIAYAEEQRRLKALEASAKAAQRAVELAQSQYEAGLTDFTNVLDAQRSLLSFEEQLARSEGAVTSNLVRLYKALGGGWTSLLDESQGKASDGEASQKAPSKTTPPETQESPSKGD